MGHSRAMVRTLDRGAAQAARRLGLALLLLFAVVVRAGVPAGWMPDARTGGLAICTGHGELILHGNSGPAAPHAADRHDVCAFAGLGSAPAPEAAALVAPAVFARAFAAERAPAERLVLQPGHRDQAARAPPRLI